MFGQVSSSCFQVAPCLAHVRSGSELNFVIAPVSLYLSAFALPRDLWNLASVTCTIFCYFGYYSLYLLGYSTVPISHL